MPATSVRTCPLCEATCGLQVTVEAGRVVRIRGDRDDVFSRGYLCPKGAALKHFDEDPDRLRQPLVKRDGVHSEVDWEEAFAEIERRLVPVLHSDRDAVAVYVGNPTAHNLGTLLYDPSLIRSLGTTNRYSASTVDQMPKQVSAGLMFGTAFTIPVPDLDRTDLLVILGANPFTSNGSLMTAPDVPGRLRAVRQRGGKVVVVDPRRTRTAEEADEHLFIRPGTDAYLLFAMVHVIFDEGLVDLGAVSDWVNGLAQVERVARDFPPEVVAPLTGIPAGAVRRLTREIAAAPSAAVYGRMGTCTQEFGTLASWLVDVVNVLTGNLDRPGGAMFPLPAAGGPNTTGTQGVGPGVKLGTRHTRVRGLRGALGELPVAALAEEILTPGRGQVRALVTVAGNPVVSTPNSAQLDAALASLDFMVSVDAYLNETTRHADVILPPPGPFARSHYDIALYRLAVRNVANYSPPTMEKDPDQPHEWEIVLRLAAIAQGLGAAADIGDLDDRMARQACAGARDADALYEAVSFRRGPERLLDVQLRRGPYGLTLDDLLAHPHGIDLGPLQPRIPECLRTPSGRIELAPPELVEDTARLRAAMGRLPAGNTLLLIGRRDLRSNNSWMHNLGVLVSGTPRCTLQVHPDDAVPRHLNQGGSARVASRVGSLVACVEITDAVMPGVVSLPHGWGHDADGTRMAVAAKHAGVNTNALTDEDVVDPLSGNAVLNGIPVTVTSEGDGSPD